MMRSNKEVVAIAAASTAAGILVGLWLGRGSVIVGPTITSRRRRRRHPVGSKADEMEQHILTTQRPASLLGITVDDYSPADGASSSSSSSLTLSAPLFLNHNVHKTAFAGSLYSVAVLCSYYLGRAWLMEQNNNNNMMKDGANEEEEQKRQQQQQQQQRERYTLVARQGSIQYRRPVTCDRIVAKSVLPSRQILTNFANTLLQVGKATMNIDGQILIPTTTTTAAAAAAGAVVACDYSIEVCAFVPRHNNTNDDDDDA